MKAPIMILCRNHGTASMSAMTVVLFMLVATPAQCDQGGIPQAVADLQQTVATLQSQLSTVQSANATLSSTVATLSTQVASLVSTNASLQSALTALTGRTSALENKDTAQDASLASLTTTVSSLNSSVAGLLNAKSEISRAHIVVQTYSVGANFTGESDGEAKCPQGEVATGGGFAANQEDFIVEASNPEPLIGGPTPPFGWLVGLWKTTNFPAGFSVWAVCVPSS